MNIMKKRAVSAPYCSIRFCGDLVFVGVGVVGVDVVGIDGCSGVVEVDCVCGTCGLETDLPSSDITCAADGETGEPSGE